MSVAATCATRARQGRRNCKRRTCSSPTARKRAPAVHARAMKTCFRTWDAGPHHIHLCLSVAVLNLIGSPVAALCMYDNRSVSLPRSVAARGERPPATRICSNEWTRRLWPLRAPLAPTSLLSGNFCGHACPAGPSTNDVGVARRCANFCRSTTTRPQRP